LARFTEGSPIEITRAIGGEAESFAATESGQIHCVLLAFQVERKESFDPFGWEFRAGQVFLGGRVFWIGIRAADFNLLGEDGLMIVVKREKALRKERPNSLLDFLRAGMHEAVAVRITGGLQLFG
jgi:hypothetical protein